MVRAKKHLGQHFLTNHEIAWDTINALTGHGGYRQVLEIGPGTGVLSSKLLSQDKWNFWMLEIDRESVKYLKRNFPTVKDKVIHGDILKWDPSEVMEDSFAVIGNFPYNISSQIFFKILEIHLRVPELVCMLQREVAVRLAASPGSKSYGILSVLLQAHYRVELLFEVGPQNFMPPPKVYSAVIRLQSLFNPDLGCDQQLFRRLVKQGFQNRRKTLRNALKPLNLPPEIRSLQLLDHRAEQLDVREFVSLTNKITAYWNR